MIVNRQSYHAALVDSSRCQSMLVGWHVLGTPHGPFCSSMRNARGRGPPSDTTRNVCLLFPLAPRVSTGIHSRMLQISGRGSHQEFVVHTSKVGRRRAGGRGGGAGGHNVSAMFPTRNTFLLWSAAKRRSRYFCFRISIYFDRRAELTQGQPKYRNHHQLITQLTNQHTTLHT